MILKKKSQNLFAKDEFCEEFFFRGPLKFAGKTFTECARLKNEAARKQIAQASQFSVNKLSRVIEESEVKFQ